MNSLTEKITQAVSHPLTGDDDFDIHHALHDVLAGIGMRPDDSGGPVTFLGADPIVPSTLRLGAVPALGMTAKSVALASLWRHRGGAGQSITMDLRKAPHRLCPFYDKKWEKLNGFSPARPHDPGNPFSLKFYETRDGRWVMPLNLYPKIKDATLRLLGTTPDEASVAAAVRTWDAAPLEQAGADAGVVMPMLRTTEEFLSEPQYRDHLAHEPLIRIEKIGESEPEPLLPGVSQPLEGLRALGMGHVIAGAGIGRDLAQHGADALNLWRPTEWENDVTYYSANVGVRSATVDPYSSEGRRRVRELLRDADVFYANRRPGFLEKIGLSAEEAAEVRPGIVYATVSLHGDSGPWADRVGFDQTAGCVSGVMLREGVDGRPALPPIDVVNDYVLSWLATTGIIRALILRATEGGSYKVSLSLSRVSAWILSLGLFDRDYAHEVAGTGGPDSPHAYLAPDQFSAQTPCGFYTGVTDQVVMSATPGRFRTVLVPRGSGAPVWLPQA